VKQYFDKMRAPKSLKWVKLLSVVVSGQVAVQAIAFLCGLAVIRLISLEEYAFYTLATTMLGAMGVIADGGVSASVMVEGGKVWREKDKLGVVIACGIQLRRKLAAYSLTIGMPLLIVLLLRNGASYAAAVGLCLALIPVFVATLSTPILDAPLRLNQQVWPLQRINIGVGLLRIGGMVSALLVWPAAAAAILTNGLTATVTNWRLRRASIPYMERGVPADAEVKAQMVSLVRRFMPSAIYYSVSSQLTIWLVSVFGSVSAIAQVGALSRIGMALAVVNSLIMTLLVPRFAQMPVRSALIARRFLQIQALLWVLALAVLGMVFVFADPILWLLGPEYEGLRWELLLMTAASLAGLAAFTSEKISQSRGWVIPPQYFIPAALILQIVLAAALRPSSASLAFIYGFCIQFATYVAYTGLFMRLVARGRASL
jgi:O-antigen/teichoic acid export membrane protein